MNPSPPGPVPAHCDLCERHGHDDVNTPAYFIDVTTGAQDTKRLFVCRRCAKETTFRNFTRIENED